MFTDRSQLQITTTPPLDGTRIVVVSGEIDLATESSLREVLLAALDVPGDGRVLVDLHAVTFVSAAGIDVLSEARQHAHEAGLDLDTAAGPGTVAGRVLTMAGWAHHGAPAHSGGDESGDPADIPVQHRPAPADTSATPALPVADNHRVTGRYSR